MGREWDGFVSRELLANPPIEPRVTLEVSQGYCLDGLTLPVIPAEGDPPHRHVRGGFCHVNQPSTTKERRLYLSCRLNVTVLM